MESFEAAFRPAAGRGLRHDRGRPSDGLQPAAARRAAGRLRRPSHRHGDRDPRRDWQALPGGAVGEVCVRGPGVVDSYRANPEATAASFRDGWFRTGDSGSLVAGRLPLAGRAHQGADQPRRREDLAARGRGRAARAIPTSSRPWPSRCPMPSTARRSARPSWRDRRSARTTCARTAASASRPSRCPLRVHVVDAIPKGPTGKVQRRLLAEQLP